MGYRSEEILGHHFSRFYTADDRAAGQPDRALLEANAHGRREAECLHVRKDGSTYVANVVLSAVRTGGGRLSGFAKVTCDVTARRRMEAELIDQRDFLEDLLDRQTGKLERANSQLRRHVARIQELAAERERLVARAFDAAERERRRMAGHIHDGPIQTLLSASQDLQDARAAISTAGGARDSLARASKLVQLAVGQLRQAATDLHPFPRETVALEQAVSSLADRAAAKGEFSYRVDVEPAPPDADTQTALTVVRELLTNVGKHAQATHVSIDARALSDGTIRVTVADDGVGMAPMRIPEALAEGHIGLALLTARVQDRGGDIRVGSHPDRGTTVTVTIPPTAIEERDWGAHARRWRRLSDGPAN
jgi:PAS domain S-box-containing protein